MIAALRRWLATSPPPAANDGNKDTLVALVHGTLEGMKGHLGIDLVRPPNPRYGGAIAVLFKDGRDVIIRFEEVRS